MRVDDVVRFIKSREHHRRVKEGLEKPGKLWDPIIAKYRFTNVNRNDDRVTQFVFKWLPQFSNSEELWFPIVVARLFNLPATLVAIEDLLDPFKPSLIRKRLHDRKKVGKNNFNAAYIVSTNGRAMDKVDYLVAEVLGPLYADRKRISRMIDAAHTLDEVHKVLMDQNGLASFMAAQVVADLKYADPDRWEDFHTFAASGPGSLKGLNYVMGAEPKAKWSEATFRETLLLLRTRVNAKLPSNMQITAQNLQNVLCELSKMAKVVEGRGKPKQNYTPFTE